MLPSMRSFEVRRVLLGSTSGVPFWVRRPGITSDVLAPLSVQTRDPLRAGHRGMGGRERGGHQQGEADLLLPSRCERC
jgi:hypothetical protein